MSVVGGRGQCVAPTPVRTALRCAVWLGAVRLRRRPATALIKEDRPEMYTNFAHEFYIRRKVLGLYTFLMVYIGFGVFIEVRNEILVKGQCAGVIENPNILSGKKQRDKSTYDHNTGAT